VPVQVAHLASCPRGYYICRRPPEDIERIRAVGSEAPDQNHIAESKDSRQAMTRCERIDRFPVRRRCGRRYNQATVRLPREYIERVLQLAGIALVDHAQLHRG
jgi:hypothetical protein